MTQNTDIPEVSICIDLERILNINYALEMDRSGEFYQVKVKGGHLAGTMDKLIQKEFVKIESIREFENGCKQYAGKHLLAGCDFIHTEFPRHWDVEKIAQETIRATANALRNGFLRDNMTEAIVVPVTDSIHLKIVVDPKSLTHTCITKSTETRHIVTAYPFYEK